MDAELTIGDALQLCFKKKSRTITQLTRYLAHFDFTPEMRAMSIFRWILDNPNDLKDRPSSRHIGVWQDKRMLETLQMLSTFLTFEKIAELTTANANKKDVVPESDYAAALEIVMMNAADFQVLPPPAAGEKEKEEEEVEVDEEEEVEEEVEEELVAEEKEELLPAANDEHIVVDLNTVFDSLMRIRTTMLAFREAYSINEPFFEVCAKLVLSEVDSTLERSFHYH